MTDQPQEDADRAAACSAETAEQEGGKAYFDQALFDLHYHLLAVRVQGLPPLPNPEDYGITVDHQGNVTRIASPV
jgi:hypothetical protein